MKIAFGVSKAPKNYLLDNGSKFSRQNNYVYGWNLENSKNMRIRAEGEDLENQCVIFSPDSQSKYCTEGSQKVSCQANDWKIQVPPGNYNVKLLIGDKKYQSQYDLSVNNVRFISGKILKKD